jgi:hypothetical protein
MYRMMRGRNTRRWAWALLMLLACAPLLRADQPLVTAAAEAFPLVEGWIRDWQAPADDPSIDLGDVDAVCITLRGGGTVLGRGIARRDEQSGAAMLSRAAGRAMIEAERGLPVDQDLLRDDAVRQFAQGIAVELELAGPLTPAFAARIDELLPYAITGQWGLAARDDGRTAILFPSQMRQAHLVGLPALRAVLGQLDRLPENWRDYRDDDGFTFYRFDVLQRVQLRAGDPPMNLHRGGRIVESTAVRAPLIRSTAARIAEHLAARPWPASAPIGVLSGYQPWNDDADPKFASPAQVGLCAFALARWSAAPGIEQVDSERALASAVQMLDMLALARAQGAGFDVAVEAMLVLAVLELPTERQLAYDELLDEAWSILCAHVDNGDLATDTTTAAVVACALARMEGARTAETGSNRARTMTDTLWRETPPGALPNMMPWLGWAEIELSAGADRIAAAGALRAMRRLVWDHRLTAPLLTEDSRDLLGGIVFTAGATPLPTWQSVRPVVMIATMLGDDRLTTRGETAAETLALSEAVRYLLQLTARDAELRRARLPARAHGGVRAAVWDDTMPLDASSMTLLCLAEVLRAQPQAIQRLRRE